MPEPQRARNMDRAERKFDVMQELGAELVLVCSNTQPATLDDDARAAADLREMAERAASAGLRVGFEALSWGKHIRLWKHAWRIVEMADHPALGLIVDSFHTLALGDDPAGIADLPGERIFFVQLADAPKRDMDVLSWSRHFRSFPGQGELDVGRLPAGGAGERVCGAAIAGSVQRPFPVGAVADDRAGRAALADPGRGGCDRGGDWRRRRRSTAWSSSNSRSMQRRARRWRSG